MSERNEDTRRIIGELDALSNRQAYLSDKLIGMLKDNGVLEQEDIDALRQHAVAARDRSIGFVVTAAMVNREQETDSSISQWMRGRRAYLRVVQ